MSKHNKLDDKTVITIAVLSIVAGIFVLSYDYLKEKKSKAYEVINFTLFDEVVDNPSIDEPVIDEPQDETNNETDNPNIDEPNTEEPKEPTKPEEPKYQYIGTLEIPKIDLKKGFVDINSKYNNVNKNVTIVKTSTYPDVDKGNFILAAHSGNSYLGYFNKLYKLSLEDIAIINYNNIRYTYKIVKIYTQPKTGKIAIYRDYDKTTLTLVTCTNDDDTTQTIYIAELISKE